MALSKAGLVEPVDSMTVTGTTPTLTIGDAGAEDTKIVFDGNAQDYHIGLDDSADDLVIGKGSTLGTTSHIVIDENGHVTMPLQSAFSVNKSTSAQTVNAAYVDAAFNNEVYDVNGDFSSDTFTAPVTGKYQLNWNVVVVDVTGTATGTLICAIRTSNRSYHSKFQDYNDIFEDGDVARWSMNMSVLADMDANDTVTFSVFSNDECQIYNDGEATHASGYLAC